RDNISIVRNDRCHYPLSAPVPAEDVDRRIALRLGQLRRARGWSLHDLADRTGISRPTVSRIERSELSPTAAMLGKLCTAYGWTLSRLMADAECPAPSLGAAREEAIWTDPQSGYSAP